MTKEKLLEHLDKFPSEFTMDELIEKLIFIDKLEKRIKESEQDETISEADLLNEISKWSK